MSVQLSVLKISVSRLSRWLANMSLFVRALRLNSLTSFIAHVRTAIAHAFHMKLFVAIPIFIGAFGYLDWCDAALRRGRGGGKHHGGGGGSPPWRKVKTISRHRAPKAKAKAKAKAAKHNKVVNKILIAKSAPKLKVSRTPDNVRNVKQKPLVAADAPQKERPIIQRITFRTIQVNSASSSAKAQGETSQCRMGVN